MTAPSIQIDAKGMLAELGEVGAALRLALEVGAEEGGKEIAFRLKAEQLSGRHADDTGLNIRTQNLYDSVLSKTETAASLIRSIVYNSGAQYWWYHQEGSGRLPKRLFFEEFFESEADEIYTRWILQSLRDLGVDHYTQ